MWRVRNDFPDNAHNFFQLFHQIGFCVKAPRRIYKKHVVSAALEKFRRKFAIGFSDCLLLEIARKAGHLPLGTFDRNLAKLDGAEKL